MNAFELRERVVGGYRDHVIGFLSIQDETIRRLVHEELVLDPPPADPRVAHAEVTTNARSALGTGSP